MFQAPVAMPRYQRLQRGARSKFGPFVQSISREQKKYTTLAILISWFVIIMPHFFVFMSK